jgi:hypothetical protein
VRYGEQGAGKGIFIHIGNVFAGTGEMVLYILPMILVLLLVLAHPAGKISPAAGRGVPTGAGAQAYRSLGDVRLYLPSGIFLF